MLMACHRGGLGTVHAHEPEARGTPTTTALSLKEILMYNIDMSPTRVRPGDRASALRCVPRNPNPMEA